MSKTIAVIIGGGSAEHVVSLNSGVYTVQSLLRQGFTVLPLIISVDGVWHQASTEVVQKSEPSLELDSTLLNDLLSGSNIITLSELSELQIDLAFIALHGTGGEDGVIQGVLELLRIPYTGSDVLASALGMNKIQFRRILSAEHVPIPEGVVLGSLSQEKVQAAWKHVRTQLGETEYIVKPASQGSSAGVSRISRQSEFKDALKTAAAFGGDVIVDKCIIGREMTIGVVGNNEPLALPVVEIIPDGQLFDYNSKYLSAGTKEICPALISVSLETQLKELAVQVFTFVGCRDYARVDVMVDAAENPFVLEINTLPGLTKASLLPKAAAVHGWGYDRLIREIIDQALRRSE